MHAVSVCGLTRAPVRTTGGFSINPDAALETVLRADTLVGPVRSPSPQPAWPPASTSPCT